jgi:hypothetical protein
LLSGGRTGSTILVLATSALKDDAFKFNNFVFVTTLFALKLRLFLLEKLELAVLIEEKTWI